MSRLKKVVKIFVKKCGVNSGGVQVVDFFDEESALVLCCKELWGRDNAIHIATRYGLDGSGIESR
jgi:hypothetical protein